MVPISPFRPIRNRRNNKSRNSGDCFSDLQRAVFSIIATVEGEMRRNINLSMGTELRTCRDGSLVGNYGEYCLAWRECFRQSISVVDFPICDETICEMNANIFFPHNRILDPKGERERSWPKVWRLSALQRS